MTFLQKWTVLIILYFPFSTTAQNGFQDLSAVIGTMDKGGQNIGVSVCDYNNDGLEDFYVVSRVGPNHFYKNLGNGVFVEQAAEMGIDFHGHSRTAIWGDLDNDGWEDMYLGNLGQRNILYRNNGDGTLTNSTIDANITNAGKVYSVNMADVNQDGWLDIYVSNASSDNVLYLNDGQVPLSFTDYTEEAGLIDTRHCMGAVFFDVENDGDEDLYVTHDAYIPNTLYLNDGDGHFTEIAKTSGVDYEGFGMGVDAGDLNNDGLLDLYVTNLYDNVLFINNGDATFSDYTTHSKVGDIGMGWGASIFDYDNDGWNDIYVGNDSYFYPIPNYLFDNKGNYKFTKYDTTAAVSSLQGTYGVATGDLNNDGLQDLLLANIGTKDHAQFFNNNMDAGYWIGFQLEGTTSNRSAIGARMEIVDNRGDLHVDQIIAGNGYAGQNTKRLHFGFGHVSAIKQIAIRWPSGLVQELEGLPLGQYYYLKEGAIPTPLVPNKTTATNEIVLDINLSIFPNPSTQYLTLSLSDESINHQDIEISVTDMLGKMILPTSYFKGRSHQLDMVSQKGMFHITLTYKGQQWSKKICLY